MIVPPLLACNGSLRLRRLPSPGRQAIILSSRIFMPHDQGSETTQLLRAWAGGDRDALERLIPRVYDELRRMARQFMKDERPGRTIQTTALVHEAYLKLIDVTNVDWQHRAHFFAVSAQIMRHILLDRARRRVAAKRGGVTQRVNLDEVPD